MRLERLELAGFMRFRDPAVLDLRDIPEGLVSITGENGHGKTRLLDAPIGALYGPGAASAFPSRDGVLADYATERDAYLEVLVAIDGRGSFRARVNVDGPKRITDAVLEAVQPDGSRVPLNDGKTTTYREQVAKLFPARELLLASAFSAQNRAGSFVGKDRKGRKELFALLLGLQHYEAMATTAKACADVVDRARLTLQARREGLARDTHETVAAVLAQRANDLQTEGGQAELRQRELQDRIAAIETERAGVADQAAQHLAALERVQALRRTAAQQAGELRQVDRDEQVAREAAETDRHRADALRTSTFNELTARTRTEVDAQAAKLKDIDVRIANNRRLLDDAEAIRAAAAAVDEATATVRSLRAQEATVRREAADAVDALRDEERMVRHGLEDARALQRDLEAQLAGALQADAELTIARQQAALISEVKFGESCAGEAPCQFLMRAVEARGRVPDLELAAMTVGPLREAVAAATTEISATQTTLDTYPRRIAQAGLLPRLDAIAEQIAIAERVMTTDGQKARLAPHVAAAEGRIEEYVRLTEQAHTEHDGRMADLQLQRRRAEQRHRETHDDITSRLAIRLEELTTRRRTLDAAQQETAAAITVATTDADATREAARALLALDAVLGDARMRLTDVERTLAAVTVRRADLERDRATFATRMAARVDVDGRLAQADAELLAWQLLQKAFGREGLPVLEIDAAGPTVSNLTNDLLNACFGPRFTVDLVTQEPKKDGKGFVEVFELKVFDNLAGGDARDIADLSGGERVIVEEALRAALAIYVNSRNETPIRTCWRDETTGALDPENAERYVAMLRRLHQLGGFAHVIFVTHNPDAAARADTQIVVRDGQPSIVHGAAVAA